MLESLRSWWGSRSSDDSSHLSRPPKGKPHWERDGCITRKTMQEYRDVVGKFAEARSRDPIPARFKQQRLVQMEELLRGTVSGNDDVRVLASQHNVLPLLIPAMEDLQSDGIQPHFSQLLLSSAETALRANRRIAERAREVRVLIFSKPVELHDLVCADPAGIILTEPLRLDEEKEEIAMRLCFNDPLYYQRLRQYFDQLWELGSPLESPAQQAEGVTAPSTPGAQIPPVPSGNAEPPLAS